MLNLRKPIFRGGKDGADHVPLFATELCAEGGTFVFLPHARVGSGCVTFRNGVLVRNGSDCASPESMKPALTFYLMGRAYDCYGGHLTLSLIPGFLLVDAPDFGPGLTKLTVTMHFPTKGPPRKTLELLYADFHANRLTLPKVVYRRSRKKASVDVASDLFDGVDWYRGLSLPLFVSGVEEMIAAIKLLRQRITAKDSFRLDLFLDHCERRKRRSHPLTTVW